MIWKKITSFADVYVLSAGIYFFVGGASAVVEWFSFFLLQQYLNVVTAAVVAFFIATAVNYVLSRNVAFRSVRDPWVEIGLLFSLSAFAFLVNLGVFLACYSFLGANVMIAKILGTGSGFALNFAARQFLVFSSASRFRPGSSLFETKANSCRRL
jgi:putative flippase GtrA